MYITAHGARSFARGDIKFVPHLPFFAAMTSFTVHELEKQIQLHTEVVAAQTEDIAALMRQQQLPQRAGASVVAPPPLVGRFH